MSETMRAFCREFSFNTKKPFPMKGREAEDFGDSLGVSGASDFWIACYG